MDAEVIGLYVNTRRDGEKAEKIPTGVIIEADRKGLVSSPNTALRWKGFTRFPIQIRSCARLENSYTIAVPSVPRSLRVQKAPTTTSTTIPTAKLSCRGKSTKRGTTKRIMLTKTKKAPVSTGTITEGVEQARGDGRASKLANNGSIDTTYPNFEDHLLQHIDRSEFLQLVRAQLAVDRGSDAGAKPLKNEDHEPRNVMYDTDQEKVMIVNFERSKLVNGESLDPDQRKRSKTHLACELESALYHMDECIQRKIEEEKWEEERKQEDRERLLRWNGKIATNLFHTNAYLSSHNHTFIKTYQCNRPSTAATRIEEMGYGHASGYGRGWVPTDKHRRESIRDRQTKPSLHRDPKHDKASVRYPTTRTDSYRPAKGTDIAWLQTRKSRYGSRWNHACRFVDNHGQQYRCNKHERESVLTDNPNLLPSLRQAETYRTNNVKAFGRTG
ncbi:uncharacterized protein F4812DRAFT_463031 [Daldinia caldariorum]|uniref:uncharacterized protein n=1 Tax=Daldinia caldariorum TaxID=326644 RepID=UPI002007D894|nr:uncharacterized protein F4812DRAFT_463031 [Daldinia caldariorum]KAI1463974.1 hypothetical protein F4812DRAFT_463031 [Daldinia caldariorum]